MTTQTNTTTVLGAWTEAAGVTYTAAKDTATYAYTAAGEWWEEAAPTTQAVVVGAAGVVVGVALGYLLS